MSTIKCRKCGQSHYLYYQVQSNGSMHLIYYCGKATIYAPFVPNLNVPILETKKEINRRNREAKAKEQPSSES